MQPELVPDYLDYLLGRTVHTSPPEAPQYIWESQGKRMLAGSPIPTQEKNTQYVLGEGGGVWVVHSM